MPTLTHRQLEQFSDAVWVLHGTRSLGDFQAQAFSAMRRILPIDICVVGGDVAGVPIEYRYDRDWLTPDIHAVAMRNLHDIPNLGGRALAESHTDRLHRSQWVRTALFNEVFRRVDLKDGIGLDVRLAAGAVSLCAMRGGYGFTDIERWMLTMFGPHVKQVLQRLQRHTWLEHRLDDAADAMLARLTPREREVLARVAGGSSNAAIAEWLGVRPGTVRRHLENIFAKLGIRSRHEVRYLMPTARDRERH
jgi:DNA-binding CsgD family transcriptional regulator